MESLQKILARNAAARAAVLDLSEPKLIKRGVPAGSANRITSPEGQNVTLAVLEKIATALAVRPWQLLVPSFNAQSPPILAGDADVEKEIERRVQVRVAEVLDHMRGMLLSAVEEKNPPRDSRISALLLSAGAPAAGKPGTARDTQPPAQKQSRNRKR